LDSEQGALEPARVAQGWALDLRIFIAIYELSLQITAGFEENPSDKELAMGTFSWQTWNSSPFNVERKQGKLPSTVILQFKGPFTVRDAYTSLQPGVLNKILELETAPGEDPPKLNILDLTACPFMDSSGLGIIATHYVRCQKQGVKMIAAGLSSKVREVFRVTKMDAVIPIAATVEEAEAS
jgi:anti-sigma B factor antagonist